MRYKHLCFDLDGTIMKTDEGVVLAHRYAAEKMKIKDVPYDRLDLFIGPSNVTFCTKNLNMDEQTAMQYDRYFVEEYNRISLDYSYTYDGMLELLRDAQKAGCANYICTAKNHVAAVEHGKHFGFGEYADGICGALDGADEKHAILKRLIEQYNLDPTQTVMIGDRYTDLDGGKKCGTHTIGVLYGYGLLPELESCKPDYIAETVSELRAYLLGG